MEEVVLVLLLPLLLLPLLLVEVLEAVLVPGVSGEVVEEVVLLLLLLPLLLLPPELPPPPPPLPFSFPFEGLSGGLQPFCSSYKKDAVTVRKNLSLKEKCYRFMTLRGRFMMFPFG